MKSLEGETVPLKNPIEITTKVEVSKLWVSLHLLLLVADIGMSDAGL